MSVSTADKMLRAKAALQAFACGDALGMPTEFMTRQEIAMAFPQGIKGLIEPALSKNHSDLPKGSVTDDTEQVIYLLRAYRQRGAVTVEDTVKALLCWIRETGAVEKHYIGPSSKKALDSIAEGADSREAGQTGVTCGGVMRCPAAVLFNVEQSEEELLSNLHSCLLPTHNTSQALEAAGAYGFALLKAVNGGSFVEILDSAVRGGEAAMALAPYIACGPSAVERIKEARRWGELEDGELLRRLYDLWGAGLPAADVCGAAFALFMHTKGDSWRAIRLGAALGGDTDTIAALAGTLSAAYLGKCSVPLEVLQPVEKQNASLLSFIEEL